MHKTKRKLLKLVSSIDREDILEYFYCFMSGKLGGGAKEPSEREKLRDDIIDMVYSIWSTDILRYIQIVVSDILEEQKKMEKGVLENA